MIALIAATSDAMITAGLARDVLAAVGQHLIVLDGAAWHTRSTPMVGQECTRCQGLRRKVARSCYANFPALKDKAAARTGHLNSIVTY